MVVLQIKVRLPGTVQPVNYLSQSQKTGRELMLDLAEQYSIQDHTERRLVWSPTVKNPGRIIEADEIVQPPDHEDTCLELWVLPSEIRVGMYPAVGANIVGIREIAVDIRSPLYFMIPIFQKAFQINEPFCFKYSESNSLTNSRWLNANYPLKDQLFGTEGCLLIYPLSNLNKHLSSIPVQKEGQLIKRSRKSKESPKDANDATTTNDKTFANEKKRWFVLRESFLFYYKNKEAQEKGPHSVIPLEYYVAKIHTSRGKDNKNKVTLTLTRSFQGFPQLKEDLLLKLEPVKGPIDNTAEQLKDWHEAVKVKCVPLKNTKIFGVDLKQLMSRNREDPNANPIPEIVRKAVAYLDCFGLEVEGILRQSGSGSLVEFYKDQFDQGIPVDLMKVQDPHVVASLLKMYLRELPEPLLTYDLYDEFIQSHGKDIDKSEKASRLTALVARLPVENQIILKYLASFLKRITEYAHVNKMNKTNLGTVFGPNLLRPRSFEDNPQKYLLDNPIINDITQTLIDEYQLFFKDATLNPPPLKKKSQTLVSSTEFRNSGTFPPKPPVKSGSLPPTPTKNKYSSIGKNSRHELIKEGYLNKRAEAKDKWKENWVKCYRNRLQFFNAPKDKVPKRTVELHSATVGTSSEKQYCLVLNDGTRLYYLCASSAPEFEDWFQLLKAITEMIMDNNNTPSLNSSSGTVTPPEPATPKGAASKELPNPPKPASATGSLERSSSAKGLPTPPGSLPKPPAKRPDLPPSFLQRSTSSDNASATALAPSEDIQDLKAALQNEVQARQALEQEVHKLAAQLQEEAKERKKLEALVLQLSQKIEGKPSSPTASQPPKLDLKPLQKSGSKPPSVASSPSQSPQISPRNPLPATPGKSASLKRVKALYDNSTPEEDDELSFKEGDIITVVKEDDGSGWFVGSLGGKQGLVPTTYVTQL